MLQLRINNSLNDALPRVYHCDDVGGEGEGECIHTICADDCVLLSYLNALLHFKV